MQPTSMPYHIMLIHSRKSCYLWILKPNQQNKTSAYSNVPMRRFKKRSVPIEEALATD